MTCMHMQRDERGVALIMALVIVLILAAITLAMGFMTSAEVDVHRLSRWDTLTQYLAQAAAEHEIYQLKEYRSLNGVDPCPAVSAEYPQLPQYTPGLGPFWYSATATCVATPGDTCPLDVNGCPTGTPATRRWTINADGQVWFYDPGSGGWTLLHNRSLRVLVDLTYVTCTEGTARCASSVTLLRWERVEP